MRAYALMRHSPELEAAYLASPMYRCNHSFVEALRSALGAMDFAAYEGIGRSPFSEWPEREPGWQASGVEPVESEPEARALLEASLGPDDYTTDSPRSFLSQLDDAREVYAALSSSHDYEIVELCEGPDVPQDLVGFDLGYWGGGNYSILCDALIWPVWHPPVEEAYAELSAFAVRLNQHLLFPSAESARDYLDWYGAQEWAEKPPEDFAIIGVGLVESR